MFAHLRARIEARIHRHRLDYWLPSAVATLTVVLLLGILLLLLFTGLRAFGSIGIGEFLLGTQWNPTGYSGASWGVVPLLIGTAMVSVLSLLFSVPLSLAIAIYLSELARPRVREWVKPALEMIAGIPSVVLGLLGLIAFAPLMARVFGLSNGLNALTASLLVAITAVPTIASIAEDALSSVSGKLREASLALGATEWQTIRRVVLPSSLSGVIAGIMLGLGRAIGETMIVLMVAGNSMAMPRTPLDPVRPMTATIAIEVKEAVAGSAHLHSLFAIGLLLFILTFVINMLADILIHRRLRHT